MNSDFSLIDSNLCRAREGLRVLSEVARYVLADQKLFVEVSALRHRLEESDRYFDVRALLVSRAGADAGVGAPENADSRTTAYALVRANANRALEGLRVLEEMSKLYAPSAAVFFKKLRYDLYQAEACLLSGTPHYHLRSYFHIGVVYAISDSVDEIVFLVEHGAKIVQLRDKAGDKKQVREKAEYLCGVIAEKNKERANGDKILFILNDDVTLAADLPVDGVHIGQDVGDISAVRRIIGSNKIIGRSNNSLEQLKKSVADGADYVSIGPVFTTPTKPDRVAVGLDVVRQVAVEITTPWLAIGGIDADTMPSVREAGAKNVAVVRAARDFFANAS